MWPIPGIGHTTSSLFGSLVCDANSNLTGANSYGWNIASYTWNAENRISSAYRNGKSESYAYDVDGARIKKVADAAITRTWFPFYEEEQVTNWPFPVNVVKHYSFAGQRVAVKRGSTLHYLHGDHLSSLSVATDSSGNGVSGSWLKYYAYGSVRQGNPAVVPTDRTYTGQKSDGTGLLYYNARYYDPALGTFLSPDTIVPDTQDIKSYNRYMYVFGNPLKYTDESGRCPWCIGAVIGGVVGGGFELGRQVLAEDKDIDDLDWRRIAISTVGGAVAGGTMGLASTASVGGIAMWGAGSSILGGQAAAITDGAFEYFDDKSLKIAYTQALNSGLFDPTTVLWDAGSGAVTGVASAGFARVLQSQFSALQGSPGEIVIQGRKPLYMVRFERSLDGDGRWVFRNESRQIIMKASGLERIVRSGAQGAAETAEEAFQNLLEEGIAWWQNDN